MSPPPPPRKLKNCLKQLVMVADFSFQVYPPVSILISQYVLLSLSL
jgi:hypothetical protein